MVIYMSPNIPANVFLRFFIVSSESSPPTPPGPVPAPVADPSTQ